MDGCSETNGSFQNQTSAEDVVRPTSAVACFEEAVASALAALGSSGLQMKEEQKRAVRAVYEGKDVFVCLPTGFGKSLCYQVLPFVFDHLRGPEKSSAVLVVSPLIALMVDQVQSLRRRGVKSSVIASQSGVENLLAADVNLRNDKLLFCSPEVLARVRWREAIDDPAVSSRIVAVAVDEAHCISKW